MRVLGELLVIHQLRLSMKHHEWLGINASLCSKAVLLKSNIGFSDLLTVIMKLTVNFSLAWSTTTQLLSMLRSPCREPCGAPCYTLNGVKLSIKPSSFTIAVKISYEKETLVMLSSFCENELLA